MIEWLNSLSGLQLTLLAVGAVISWCIGFGMGIFVRGVVNNYIDDLRRGMG